jgi:hypothetical protein
MNDTPTQPKFLSLHDLGLLLLDSGRRTPTRQTLIRRGRAFAEATELRVFKIRGGEFVSAAEVERLHHGAAA